MYRQPLFLVVVVVLALPTLAAAADVIPTSQLYPVRPLSEVMQLNLPKVDIAAAMAEDVLRDEQGFRRASPYRTRSIFHQRPTAPGNPCPTRGSCYGACT